MRIPTDLHPDDRDNRIALRDTLTARRRDLGYSQRHLGQLAGRPQSAIAHFEGGDPQRITPTSVIAAALGMRIVMYPAGVPGGPYDDPTLLLFRPTSPHDAAVWDQQHLMGQLADARRACGVTQAHVGRILGSSENEICVFERGQHGRLFGSVQRFCRALDGWLWLGVEELPARSDELAGVA